MSDEITADTLTIDIVFHTPFRVASGQADDGLSATYRPDDQLPASSLKGLMRAQAGTVLGIDAAVVAEVFGSAHKPSPWWWSDADLQDSQEWIRTSLRINADTGTAADGALRTSGEVWPGAGSFVVRRRDLVPAERVALHLAVLAASARSVTSLGSDRRRGLGWVSFRPQRAWDEDQMRLLLAARGQDV